MSKTLWEEGRAPATTALGLTSAGVVLFAVLDVVLTGRLSLFFDLAFVTGCVAAALVVTPRRFFSVGVMPPLLMLAIVLVLALVSPGTVADERDGAVQAVVSGLAHHAVALAVGYALVLAVLAVRQSVLRSRRVPA